MTEVFEYALVRVVPRVERGEAINAGVIVYSHRHRYLAVRIELDVTRLLAVDPAADVDAVRSALSAFEKACTEGPLADRPLGERFRWLTAPSPPSSSLAPSTAASPRTQPPSSPTSSTPWSGPPRPSSSARFRHFPGRATGLQLKANQAATSELPPFRKQRNRPATERRTAPLRPRSTLNS